MLAIVPCKLFDASKNGNSHVIATMITSMAKTEPFDNNLLMVNLAFSEKTKQAGSKNERGTMKRNQASAGNAVLLILKFRRARLMIEKRIAPVSVRKRVPSADRFF